MAKDKTYGIKYPFTNRSWRGGFTDLNDTEAEYIQSEILHIMFTPKGQRLRMPNFGSDLVKYIFEPNDGESWENMKSDIKKQVSEYLPNVTFKNLEVYMDPDNEHSAVVDISYIVKHGKVEEEYKVSVPVV